MSVFRFIDVGELEVRNPILLSHTSVTSASGTDTVDTGLISSYYDGANTVFNGLFRKGSSGKFQLFSGLQDMPNVATGEVNTAGTGYAKADLDLRNIDVAGTAVITGNATVNTNLAVAGTAEVTGNTTLSANLAVAGTAAVTGNTTLSADLAVAGAAVITGNATVNTNLAVAGTAAVTGNTTLSADLAVVGNTQTDGDANVDGNVTVAGNTSVSSNLIVAGTAAVTGNTTLSANLAVAGTASVTGNTTLSADLAVAGAAVITGSATVNTNLVVAGTAAVTGNTTLSADLAVAGAAVITGSATVNTNLSVAGTALITGNTSVSANLAVAGTAAVTGNTTLSADLAVAGVAVITGNTTLNADLAVAGNTLIEGNTQINGDFIVSGTLTTFDVNTLNVEDNIIVANAGPSNVKPDGGFVVKRAVSSIVGDAPKQSGTAPSGMFGSSTSILLQPNNGHGTALDYYKGWVIKLGGDVTGSAMVTGSTAATPPVLTFDTAASGPISSSTTYQLFNKVYVGTIWDESTGMETFYGFPRETSMGSIDLAGDAGDGNLADYIDTRMRDLHVSRDLYVEGVIKSSVRADDNIITVNAGPTNSEDAGFVVTRAPARVVANDTPLETGTASAAGTTTTVALQAANGHGTSADYYEGWVIKFGGDVTGTATVLSSTAANPSVLTFNTEASAATTTATTYELFNKTYVGTIYDESTKTLMAVGFPREVGEGVIDPVSPVNGNVPSYVDFSVKDLTVSGQINIAGGNQVNTIKLETAGTVTAEQLLNKDVIYFNPAAPATFTLDNLAALALATNKSKNVMFVNISEFVVTLVSDLSNTIEGLANLKLGRQYAKTVLTASPHHPTVWTIKG